MFLGSSALVAFSLWLKMELDTLQALEDREKVVQVNLRSCTPPDVMLRVHWCHSLGLGGPGLVPALLLHPDESQDLEAQAGEDLSQNRAEQRAGDEAGRWSAPHQLLPRRVQAH